MFRFILSATALIAFAVYTFIVLADQNIITYILALEFWSWGMQVFIDLIIACTLVLIFIWHDARRQGWGLPMILPFYVLTLGLGSIGLLAYFTVRNFRLMKSATA